jgi:hypothetical protein
MVSLMGSEGDASSPRFRDPLLRLPSFSGEILVRCPRCDARAAIRPEVRPEAENRAQPWGPRRLTCPSCGLADRWTMPRSADDRYGIPPEFGGPDDPYFGIPLWLATVCGGHVLWAYNVEHLDLLESYVSARLRERGSVPGSMSLVERLPAWIKDGRHRRQVLSGIRRLRAMAP